MSGQATQGTQIKHDLLDDGNMVLIKCASAITIPEITSDQIDVTCLESTQAEFIAGLPTPGAAGFDFRYEGADAGHQLIIADSQDSTARDYEITFTDGSNITFEAQVSGMSSSIGTNDTVVFSAALTVTGLIVWDFTGATPISALARVGQTGSVKRRGARQPAVAA